MNVHKSIQTKEKPLACDICKKRYSNKACLSKHLKYHTLEKQFICEFCSKGFLRQHILRKHLRTHTKEKPYICNICSKGFSERSSLRKHIYVHTKEKPFICEVCSRGFSQRSSLATHRNTHLEEKPFTCEICNKGFCQKQHLANHHRSHNNEKPFVCDICERRYAQKNGLNQHYVTHTNEKPFTCEICDKKYPRKTSLTRHLHLHSNKRPFSCEFCCKRFPARYLLKQHLHGHSGRKPEVKINKMPTTSSGATKANAEKTVIPAVIIKLQRDTSTSQVLPFTPSTLPEDESTDNADEDRNINGVAEAVYQFAQSFKQLNQKTSKLKSQLHLSQYKNILSNIEDDVEKGHILAESQNFARILMEIPANNMTLSIFASTVEEKFRNSQVHVIVRHEKWIEFMKMGALLRVSKGSDEPPKFLELHYNGLSNSKEIYALVGKGVIGGPLKPSTNINKMQADMSGAACVVAIILAASSLKMKINIKGFIPLTENLPSEKAPKPGEVVHTMNGKAIQIDNTDAQGKLILADALCYAQKFNPTAILDAATLTGSDNQRKPEWNVKGKKKCSSLERVRQLFARQNFLNQDAVIETQSNMHNELQQIRSNLEKIADDQEQLISLHKSTNAKLDLLIQVTALGHGVKIIRNS